MAFFFGCFQFYLQNTKHAHIYTDRQVGGYPGVVALQHQGIVGIISRAQVQHVVTILLGYGLHHQMVDVLQLRLNSGLVHNGGQEVVADGGEEDLVDDLSTSLLRRGQEARRAVPVLLDHGAQQRADLDDVHASVQRQDAVSQRRHLQRLSAHEQAHAVLGVALLGQTHLHVRLLTVLSADEQVHASNAALVLARSERRAYGLVHQLIRVHKNDYIMPVAPEEDVEFIHRLGTVGEDGTMTL